jgi:hypothetical protein
MSLSIFITLVMGKRNNFVDAKANKIMLFITQKRLHLRKMFKMLQNMSKLGITQNE